MLLEILTKVSYNWSAIIDEIWVYETNMEYDFYLINGSNINWSPIPQYPNCQVLDIKDYLDFDVNPMIDH